MSDSARQAGRAGDGDGGGGNELRLDVWQFVRLMVQMEETLESAPGRGSGSGLRALYDLWEDLWVDIDARLVDLGKRDADGFADLMMNQEVVLTDVPAGAPRLAADELDKVVAALNRRLAGTEDPGEVADLSFERDELSLTARRLRGGSAGPGGKGAGARKAGGKKAGGKHGGGKHGGGKRAGGKQPGGKQPGGKRPGGGGRAR